MSHLLVTNDFPPRFGGIQSYLWELWRRLDPKSFAVLTTDHPGAGAFDRSQPFRVERIPARILLPTPGVRRRIVDLASEIGAGLVVLDPAFPLGAVGPTLSTPYALVLHGAEVTVPGRLPVTRQVLARSLAGACLVVTSGGYSTTEAGRALGRCLPNVALVPPGVDGRRFRPLSPEERSEARATLGLPCGGALVVSVSRLVPRKGMDTLIAAAARLARSGFDLTVAIAGDGRDRGRLERAARSCAAPVRFLGGLTDAELPGLYGAADVFAMLCRNRWRGLEQEGFGIVFLEAAACGVPQVAGSSGGAAEAVVDGRTGVVLERPADPAAAAAAIGLLLGDEPCRVELGEEARLRALSDFDYDQLALRLSKALAEAGG